MIVSRDVGVIPLTDAAGITKPYNYPSHKGIDIGAVSGTKIKSAIEGVVTQVSSKGDYRKSY